MKPQNSIHILILTVCLAFSPKVQAVSPPPDGCYPGFTTAEGCNALQFLGAGAGNTGVGWYSLYLVGGGNYNTGVGAGTLVLNTADSNTAVGAAALLLNTSGSGNTANGVDALVINTTGSSNTAVGADALLSNTTGSGNIALGQGSGSSLTTGNFNIDIDNAGVAAESDTIRIGLPAVQTKTFIAGIRGATTGNNDAIPVVIDSAGQLGTMSSSRRFKKEIKPMDQSSEAILQLRPVTFHYKNDSKGIPQFGLIAEQVAQVNPDLVVRDANGGIYTVRYDAVNAMLLNEFLKEHRKVEQQDRKIQEQETTIAELKKEVEAVVAHAKQQDAKIQNVSEQMEVNAPDRRVANNNY